MELTKERLLVNCLAAHTTLRVAVVVLALELD
jgi:hypothetical protein